MHWTIWSPEPRRRRARAAARSGELRAVATELERERGEDGKVAMLTAVATEQAAGSETSCSSGDGGGDLRRGAAKARSVAELRGKRALGARLARRSGRWQSCRTQWNGARSTVATVTPVRCLRRRRPWWGKGEGEAMGESDDVQGLGARRGRSSSSSAARAASSWRGGELALAASPVCLLWR